MDGQDAGNLRCNGSHLSGLLVDARVNEFLQRGVGDLPRNVEDEERHENGTCGIHPGEGRADVRGNNGYRNGNRADGVGSVVPGVGLKRG